MELRRFELVEGSSDKFWSVGIEGVVVRVQYGRNGTNGQTKDKTCASPVAAETEAAKLVAAKVKKGYVEVGAESSPAPATPAAVEPEPQPVAAPAAEPAAELAGLADHAGDPAADDIGFVAEPYERAAIGGGQPIAATIPEPDGTPEQIVARWEAWVSANAVADHWTYRPGELFLHTPFTTLPDPVSARWWRAYLFNQVPEIREPENPTFRAATFEEWAHVEERGYIARTYGGRLDKRQRLARARAVALDPAETLPPPLMGEAGRTACLDPISELAVDLVLEGPSAMLAIMRPDVDWLVALRALAPSLGEGVAAAFDAAVLRAEERIVNSRHHQAGAIEEARVRFARLRRALLASPSEQAELAAAADEEIPVRDRLIVALGLPDPRARESVWLRGEQGISDVNVWTSLPDGVTIAGIGRPAFDRAVAVILARTAGDDAASCIRRVGARVHGGAAVPGMLRLAADSRAPAAAREWLRAHAGAVAAYDGPLSKQETGVLDGLVREILTADPSFAPRHPQLRAIVDTIVRATSLPEFAGDEPWWVEALAAEAVAPEAAGKLKVLKKLPAWATSLPPLIVGEVRLSAEQRDAVLLSAMRGARDETLAPRPLLAAVRDRMSDQDRDQVASALLQGFLGNGAASGERALFVAAGFLGADGFVAELTPLVRAWPGESQHQRAVLGLDVLAATGTGTAMSAISGIANKSKFKGVQKAANESLERLAALQGLSVEEFQDRVVPDAGLDEQGTRILDYGPRRFRVRLSPEGKAIVHALDAEGRPEGKPRTALPAPNSKDDADLAAAAKKEFTLLRKQLTDAAKIQTARLDQAMVTGRVWSAGDHEAYLARHPVLNALIRPLVWRVAAPGAAAVLLRVNEDREYVTVDDEPYALPADATLTLAHPLGLEAPDVAAWRAHLSDYELVSPVEQLDRATYPLPEGSGLELAGLPTNSVNPGALLSRLERHGWRRGEPQDGGVIPTLSLPFPAFGVAVIMEIDDGLWVGMIHESGPQTVERVSAVALERVTDGVGYFWASREQRIDWNSVDPVVVSEVGRSLDSLREEG